MFYFTCRLMNLEYMKVSQFEINYKKEINLTQYSYFLRSTCIQFVYIDNKKKILITDIENWMAAIYIWSNKCNLIEHKRLN